MSRFRIYRYGQFSSIFCSLSLAISPTFSTRQQTIFRERAILSSPRFHRRAIFLDRLYIYKDGKL